MLVTLAVTLHDNGIKSLRFSGGGGGGSGNICAEMFEKRRKKMPSMLFYKVQRWSVGGGSAQEEFTPDLKPFRPAARAA